MKKLLLVVVILGVAGYAGYKLFIEKEDGPAKEKPKPLSIGNSSDRFAQSYDSLLGAYFAVKDALVESDTVKTNVAAAALAKAAEQLSVNEISGDSTGMIKETALNFSGTITGSAQALAGEATLDNKRKEFEMISDALWSLTRVVKYSGSKIYYQFCPMAFNNKGAYWMSREEKIRNPYFGDKMLSCGSNQDSLEFKN